MAAVEKSKLAPQEHDELRCVYASLILNDAGMPVNVQFVFIHFFRKRKSQS